MAKNSAKCVPVTSYFMPGLVLCVITPYQDKPWTHSEIDIALSLEAICGFRRQTNDIVRGQAFAIHICVGQLCASSSRRWAAAVHVMFPAYGCSSDFQISPDVVFKSWKKPSNEDAHEVLARMWRQHRLCRVNDRLGHRTHSEIDTTLSCQSADSGKQMVVGQLAVAFHIPFGPQCASRTGKVSAVHFHLLLVANYPNWMAVTEWATWDKVKADHYAESIWPCQVLHTWRKHLQSAGLWQAVPCHLRSFARSRTRTGGGHILKFKSTKPLPSNQSLARQQTDHIRLGWQYASKSRKLAAAHHHLFCSKGLRQVIARLDLNKQKLKPSNVEAR